MRSLPGMDFMLLLSVLAACSAEPDRSSNDPAEAGLTLFKEIRRAQAAGDGEAMWRYLTAATRKELVQEAREHLDSIRGKPRKIQETMRMLSIEEDPTKIPPEELAQLGLGVRIRTKRRFDEDFGTRFLEFRIENDQLILVTEGSERPARGRPVPYRREHVFVREAGRWALDDDATARRASGQFASFPAQRVDALAFSGDGEVLAALSNKQVHLWDWAAEERIATVETTAYRGLVAHPHKGWFAVPIIRRGRGRAVALIEAATGHRLGLLATGEVKGMALSPDGTRLAVAGKKGVDFWDPATGERVHRIPGGDILGIAYFGDGKRVMLRRTLGRYEVRDVAGKLGTAFKTELMARTFGPTPDGLRLLVLHFERVDFFDAGSGRIVDSIQRGGSSFTYGAKGTELLVVDGGSIVRWRTGSHEIVRVHQRAGGPIAVHPDGKILAATRGLSEVLLLRLE